MSRHTRCMVVTLMLAVLLIATSLGAEEPVVGRVLVVQGKASVLRGTGLQPLARGSELRQGDELVTGPGARLQLRLADGTLLNLGAGSRFTLHRVDSRSDGEGMRLELISGAFRAVTGAIGRDFLVATPVATIGIRGTDLWGGFEFGDALDIALLDGGPISVENGAGRVDIATPGHGTTVTAADRPPSVPRAWPQEKIRRAAQATALVPSDGAAADERY